MQAERTSAPCDSDARAGAMAAGNPLEEWLRNFDEVVEVERGDIVEGTIVAISPMEILVDIGCKADGVVPSRELERMSPEELAELRVGDRIPVYVVRPEDADGNVILSIRRARSYHDWRKAEELMRSETIFEGRVVDCNRGGVIVHIGRLRGFLPASQIVSGESAGSEGRRRMDDENRWRCLVGRTLKLKVIEVDRNRNRLILSEKAALRECRQAAKQKLIEQLQVGEVRRGVVTSICEFGAFVDLGGADGLIHLSELSWERVNHPSEVVQVGQEVEVYVLEVDYERQRIGLSIRQLQTEPWEKAIASLCVGQIVQGTITKVMPFGAFARIADCLEGLIHISELSDGRVNHPREVVKEGDVVSVKIVRIDPQQRRIGLSLKQAQEELEEDFDWRQELEYSLKEEHQQAEDT